MAQMVNRDIVTMLSIKRALLGLFVGSLTFMSSSPRQPHLVTVTLMAGVAVLSLNMIVPAFPEMADAFGVSYTAISFLFTGYLIITGFLTLLAGPLSDRYGRRPVAVWGLVLFVVASGVCAVTPDLGVLYAARIAQTVVVGSAVISQAVIRDTSGDTADTTRRLASIAIIIGLAPLLGPTLGGVISDLFGWRAVFVAQMVFGLAVLILTLIDLSETNQHKSATFAAQFRDYPTIIASAHYWGFAITLCFGVSTFFVFLAGMPLIGSTVFGFSQTQIGMVLGTLTVGYIFANAITRQAALHFRASTLMVFGRCIGVLGAAGSLLFIYLGFTSPYILIPPLMLLGAANGFTVQPANAGVVSVNPKLAGSAAGLSGALIYWIGAGASTLMSLTLSANPSALFFVSMLFGATCLGLIPALFTLWLDRRDARKRAAPR